MHLRIQLRQVQGPPFGDICMLTSSASTTRKRARSEPWSEVSAPTKRTKVCHFSHPPSAYWDNLSTISLTKGSLAELNRRNTQAVQGASCTLQQELGTTNDKEAVDIKYDSRTYKELRTFSRHGGPDLSKLRNVRSLCYLVRFPDTLL